MTGQWLQFGGSLLAVAVLVSLAWLLGFRTAPRLDSVEEAADLLRLMPGGFEPAEVALANAGSAAIARDGAGRVAVLLPHGSQFVAKPVPPGTRISAHAGVLEIALSPPLSLDVGEHTQGWITADSHVS